MRRIHPIRRVSVGVLVVATSIVTLTAGGPAGATTGGSVTCTTVTGGRHGPTSMFSCSASIGSSGTIEGNPPKPAFPFFTGTRTGTIYWNVTDATGALETVIHVTTRAVKKKDTPCLGETELKVNGVVDSDTSGYVSVGGPVSGTLCEMSNGTFTLLGGTEFVVGW
jgi:hypothetical protein